MATARLAAWVTYGALAVSPVVLGACNGDGGNDGDGKGPLASTDGSTDGSKPDAPVDAADDVVMDPATAACLKSKTGTKETPCTCSVYGCFRASGDDWMCEKEAVPSVAVVCAGATNAAPPVSCATTQSTGHICGPQAPTGGILCCPLPP